MDFTTLVGAVRDLRELQARWDRVGSFAPTGIEAPEIVPDPSDVNSPRFSEPDDVRVAVVRHAPAQGGDVLRLLSAMTGDLGSNLVQVAAGFWLAPAMGVPVLYDSDGVTNWQMRWNERRLQTLLASGTVDLSGSVVGESTRLSWPAGRQVTIIDTGDVRAHLQHSILIDKVDVSEPRRDVHGHGTAVGDVIRLLAPNAEICSVRVFEPDDRFCSSAALLAALAYATSRGSRAQVVCVAQRGMIDYSEAGGALGSFEMAMRGALTFGGEHPIVVAAAGNNADGPLMSVPAIVPGVAVALGSDWNGRPAPYNCRPPLGVSVATAHGFGGVDGDPLGHLYGSGAGTGLDLVGSSFAAAVIAAVLLRG